MKKQAHPEVWARLEGQMRAGLALVDEVRSMKGRNEIKAFQISVLCSDPFVVQFVDIEPVTK